MNRRDTLKKMMLASGALVALPAWADEWGLNDLVEYNSSFSPASQEILTSVADTIIPTGESPGALSVGVDKFLQKLFDDCYEKDVQDNIKKQLDALNAAAQTTNSKSFAACDQKQREDLLLKLADSTDKEEKDFFDLMKSETIRGFNTSREVMTNYLNYKVAPGHYHGCVDINA
jgi:acyl-CoA reductase-like NAD-dependent aldehyde dehydrogenase